MKIERVNVLGVGISVLNMELARQAITEALRTKTKGYICVTGVHGVMEAQADPRFKAILNRAFLNTPDGMPMVWMGKLMGMRHMDRVYGPDLMEDVFQVSAERGDRHFFYGGANGAAMQLKAEMIKRFPGSQIVGAYEPPFRPLNPGEERALIDLVRETKPEIFWVGLSTPKQEKFMAAFLPKLEVTLMIGVGAAFDFHSGRVKQAPRWIQRSGLEWLYRLGREPKRLWKRYLRNNPRFVVLAGCQLLGIRKFELE